MLTVKAEISTFIFPGTPKAQSCFLFPQIYFSEVSTLVFILQREKKKCC